MMLAGRPDTLGAGNLSPYGKLSLHAGIHDGPDCRGIAV